MVYRVPLLRVNTDILANIFAVIANLEKKESGGCNVAVDNATVSFKVTIERTFWALWFSCFYDNFAYTLANATWSAMCQNVLMSKLEANFYGRQKCSFNHLWSDFVADFDLPLDIWKFHLSIFIGLFWTLLILWSLTQIEVLRVIHSQSKITEIAILKNFC